MSRTSPDTAARSYGDPGVIFSNAAAYYRYRPPLPEAVVEFVADRASQVGGTVLDLACGPGTIAIPLAEHGLHVLAADASTEMLDIAMERAVAASVRRIRWLHARAEDIADRVDDVGVGSVVISDAFHYLNGSAILTRLDRIVAPGGFVALVCSRADGSPRPWWYPIVERLVDKHVGPRRLAGPGQTYEPPQRDHESVLRASPFARLTRLTVDYTIDVPLARLVLAQLSYAFSSPAVFGDRQAAFIAELRDELRNHLAERGGDWQQRCVARLQAGVILGERDD